MVDLKLITPFHHTILIFTVFRSRNNWLALTIMGNNHLNSQNKRLKSNNMPNYRNCPRCKRGELDTRVHRGFLLSFSSVGFPWKDIAAIIVRNVLIFGLKRSDFYDRSGWTAFAIPFQISPDIRPWYAYCNTILQEHTYCLLRNNFGVCCHPFVKSP